MREPCGDRPPTAETAARLMSTLALHAMMTQVTTRRIIPPRRPLGLSARRHQRAWNHLAADPCVFPTGPAQALWAGCCERNPIADLGRRFCSGAGGDPRETSRFPDERPVWRGARGG